MEKLEKRKIEIEPPKSNDTIELKTIKYERWELDDFANKINEIIDFINKLKEGSDEK